MAHADHYHQTFVEIQCQALNKFDSIKSLRALFKVWHERSKQRQRLANLSEELLRDIGLTEEDIKSECAKNFWQA